MFRIYANYQNGEKTKINNSMKQSDKEAIIRIIKRIEFIEVVANKENEKTKLLEILKSWI